MHTNLKETLFFNNKYTKWYFSIITGRKTRILNEDIYKEKHHIIPKSLGGTDDVNNIVELTGKEHFLVHWLLTKMCIKNSHTRKMQYAMRSMSWNKTGNKIISSWQFELSRKNISESAKGRIVSESTRKKLSEAGKRRFANEANRIAMGISKNSSYHSKHTTETKEKIGASSRERYKLEENRKKTGEATKKAQNTDEFRKKRSILTKQRYVERPELRELCSKHFKGKPKDKVTCSHCGKIGGGGTMIRWHFDNCKLKGDSVS